MCDAWPPAQHAFSAADTRDVAGTVEQVKRCVDAGADIVRITVQGKKEAAACMDIREALFKDRWAGAFFLSWAAHARLHQSLVSSHSERAMENKTLLAFTALENVP